LEFVVTRRASGAGVAGSLLLALHGPACAEPKLPIDPSLVASDTALLRDESKATAEFQRRLRDQVSYRNGLLVIVDKSGGTPGVMVMPAGVMWGLDCGDSGIGVTFGTGSGDTDNGIVLQLTSAAVTDDKCQHMAPTIGETLLAITKGN
jgi:hypothetical protein